MFKNQLSVVPTGDGRFAIAVDKVPTGQIFNTKEQAKAELEKIRAQRKAKLQTPKNQ
jgi:hypothetical protein